VLVVDEDPDIRDLLAWRLGRAGFAVACEPDGERGLATALRMRPDIVVLDGSAPILGGLEFCRRLRGDPATARTKVLLVTSLADSIPEARSAGADALVAKPFITSDVVARVRVLAWAARPDGA
jgi:DNA-binding response OmpR family regulator